MIECGYEWDDDYECRGPSCTLERGHSGAHQATWETRPLDICLAEGHLWDLWQTYTPERHFGGSMDWKLAPMRERSCLRCGRQDYEGGERNPDISDVLLASLVAPSRTMENFLGSVDATSGSHSRPQRITWVEDRLNPRSWRP